MRLLSGFLQTLACLLLYTSAADAHSSARDALNYLTLVENAKINTPNKRVHAYSSFDLTFDLHQPAQHIRLALEPNPDILPDDAQIQIIGSQGEVKSVEKLVREQFKVYLGTAYVVNDVGHSTQVGTARITVRQDGVHPLFEGAFTIRGDHHHIQMKSNYMATKHRMDPALEPSEDEYMAVWRDSDVGGVSSQELRKRMAEPSCGADSLSFNTDMSHPISEELLKRSEGRWGISSVEQLLGKRQNIDGGGAGNDNSAGVNLRSSIGDTTGCPKQRQVALVGVATDCSYFSDLGSNRTAVTNNVVNVVNTASDLYQSTFNITLGLRNLTIIDQDCTTTSNSATPWNVPCSDSVDMGQRLDLFSRWRAQQSDTNAYWSLFTKCPTGSEVGLAWLRQLCNHGGTSQETNGQTQVVVGANVVARIGSEWQIFAHETGHTFGAVHDCTSDTCNDGTSVDSAQCCPLSANACDANSQYLMNPFSSSSITRFSPCSVGNICSALGRNLVQSGCLTNNRGVVTVTGAVCGNGIVEEGEQCDCGGAQGCQDNSCCNPSTCQYTTNSVCDWSNEGCCTRQCQLAGNGTVCRTSTGFCDPAETCSGTSGQCPPDQSLNDGDSCGDGLQCASGQCTSRTQQCENVMGNTGFGSNGSEPCDSDSCMIRCRSPQLDPRTCVEMRQNFLDGTPCQGGGHCVNGNCEGSSLGGRARAWINDNKALFISLVSVIGGLILIGVLSCIVSCFRRRRRARARPAPARFQQPMTPAPYFHPPPPPPSYGGYGNSSVRYA